MLFVANLWKKLMPWAVCVRDVRRPLDRLTSAGGSERAGTPCPPWERVQGLLLRSGADFRAARRWSTNGADLKALEVFGEWSTTEKAVVQDPGGDF